MYRGAGALLFLTTGRCTKMVGIASGFSLLLKFVHDKLVCLKMCLQSDLSLVSTHNSLFFGLPTYCTYHMVVKGTVIGNTDDSLQ